MSRICPDIVVVPLGEHLSEFMAPMPVDGWPIDRHWRPDGRADPSAYAQLVSNVQEALDSDLPAGQVDLVAIGHLDRLIEFICRHG